MHTPKERMLNAYRGLPSDRAPVAPEFWYYIAAKVMDVGLMELEREIPLWKALQAAFTKYHTEGWGIAFPTVQNEDIQKSSELIKLDDGQYLEKVLYNYRGNSYETQKIFSQAEPSWVRKHIADTPEMIPECVEMLLSDKNQIDFAGMTDGYREVGDDYLLEVWIGLPFFDFIAEIVGFESAIQYFVFADEAVITALQSRYVDYQSSLIDKICDNTSFEAFSIGCSYSCNSLIGPGMWRKWDKPYIKAMADRLHARGKLLHIHFHGRAMETIEDFKEIGIDCVCPFERGPGGDVDGLEGLLGVRKALGEKVTFNGNVHTVETLIRGTPSDVRREVNQIKEAFQGSCRFIIGTGDQVGAETPEENLYAMIDEAVKR